MDLIKTKKSEVLSDSLRYGVVTKIDDNNVEITYEAVKTCSSGFITQEYKIKALKEGEKVTLAVGNLIEARITLKQMSTSTKSGNTAIDEKVAQLVELALKNKEKPS